MNIVIQRVINASVSVEGECISSIDKGILIFVGFEKDDKEDKIKNAVNKIINLRIFEDKLGKMNLSSKDISCKILVVPNFTLVADTSRGNRPSFDTALNPKDANILYIKFIEELKNSGFNVAEGSFGKKMNVSLINDGPVTFYIKI
jgi:D-tyrosyl-tRNA(Tyr) deacylase